MKLKYMIRGLGIGIIITAAIMGAYNRNAVADARVQVMKQYGLGEEPKLVDEIETSEENTEVSTVVETSEPVILRDEAIESEINAALDTAIASEYAEAATEAMETQTTQAEELTEQEGQQEQLSTEAVVVVEPSAEADVDTGDARQITVAKGDDSGTVARKLYNAGLIENAAEYDAFLMQHGYDKKISTGTKTIYTTDSWQEIAEKLISK